MCICDDGTFVAGARMLDVLGAGKVRGNGKGQRLRRAARISADRAHALIPKLTSGRATQRLLHALSLWRRCLHTSPRDARPSTAVRGAEVLNPAGVYRPDT